MLSVIYRWLIFLCCFLFFYSDCPAAQTSGDSSDQVWQVASRRWNIIEEQRFAHWVESTINEDFFIDSNIPIDCADVPYAIRWIYARIAHLPAAATMPDGQLIGHWSTLWKNLPTDKEWFRDKRFRMSLLHLLSGTSTQTLPADTYPIRIAQDSVMAGAVFIGYGHAGLIGPIVLNGSTYSPVQTWEATLPRKIKKLSKKNYFAARANSNMGSGLMRFRWPILSGNRWKYLPKEEHPFYSMEQYGPDFNHTGSFFGEEVAKRIDPRPYDPQEKARLIIGSIYEYLLERAALVEEGYRQCLDRDCAEGSYLWEAYSTPSRDDRLAFKINHLRRIIKNNRLDEGPLRKIMEGMVIPVNEDLRVTVNYVVQNYRWLSHDPRDPIDARWGLRKCEMILAEMDATLQALDFAKRRYSITNAEYYERRRQMNLADLRRLKQDGERSGCKTLDIPIPGTLPPQPSPGR
jgi:hypothetical protein